MVRQRILLCRRYRAQTRGQPFHAFHRAAALRHRIPARSIRSPYEIP